MAAEHEDHYLTQFSVIAQVGGDEINFLIFAESEIDAQAAVLRQIQQTIAIKSCAAVIVSESDIMVG